MDNEALQIFETFLTNHRHLGVNDTLEQIIERQLPKICSNDVTKAVINKVDEILKQKISAQLSLLDLLSLIYCGAQTVVQLCRNNNVPVYSQADIPEQFPRDAQAQKKLYKVSPTIFTRLLFQKQELTTEWNIPSREKQEKLESAWSQLWGEGGKFTMEAASNFISAEEARVGTVSMTDSKITLSDLRKALKEKKNWSRPGVDGVQTFWYKKFPSVQEHLVKKINETMANPELMPEFFTLGFTELFPKSEDTTSPSNYRPIAYLPAIYKIITRCIYEKIFAHYQTHRILADEQSGGRRGCFGVRKNLVVDCVAMEQESVRGCYVDFRKAFDMVPHLWISTLLRIYGVDPVLVNFLEMAMKKWKTRLYLKPDVLTNSIAFRRGVFQGDSMSVILYWTAVNPLSFALKRTNLGLTFPNGGLISHMLYMDDLKLYSSDFTTLKEMIQVVREFSNATLMEINYDKTQVFSIPSTKIDSLRLEDEVELEDKVELKYCLEKTYLGYEQNPKLENDKIRSVKAKKYSDKCEKINTTEISDEDKAKVKMILAMKGICSTFGLLHWNRFDKELLEMKIKKKSMPGENDRREDIYLRHDYDLEKMRKQFSVESDLKVVLKNDKFTPLFLADYNG
jgi:hypothetical protein